MITTAVLSVLACTSQASGQTEFEKNQQKWNTQKPGEYSYQLKVGCFCPPDITRPVTITVSGGTSSLTYADDGTQVSNDFFIKYNTIEKIFDVALNALQNADETQITYDEKYGFPTSINIDMYKDAIDDETSYTISDFRPL
jgi:hypothetical protein